MKTTCRVMVPAIVGCVLIIGMSAAPAADEDKAKSRASELTAEQKAKLKERDGLVREAEQFRDKGKDANALERAARALTLTRAVRGGEHEEVAQGLTRLGELQELAGDFTTAVKYRMETLTLRLKLDGEKHWRTGDARRAVSFTQKVVALKEEQRAKVVDALRKEQQAARLDGQDKYAEAERLALEALAAFEEVQGKSSAETARVWHLLGRSKSGREALPEAKAAIERAVAIRRAVLEEGHPDLGRGLNDLGIVQYDLREHSAAKKSHEEAFSIFHKALPKYHPDIADSLKNLGLVQIDLREYAGARESYEEALAIYRKALPKDAPVIGGILSQLGIVQYELRDYAAAMKSCKEALPIYPKGLPRDHPAIAAPLNFLGLVQMDLREYGAAKKSYEEALAILRRVLPKDHPNIAHVLDGLGNAQRGLREYGAAKKSYEEVLAILRKALPKDHPNIAVGLNALGLVQCDLRDYAAAKKSYEEALAIRRKAQPKNFPALAESLNGVGIVQWKLQEFAAAKKSQEEALAIRRQSLPQDHPDIAVSLVNLGLVQLELREYEAAKKSHEEALAIFRKVLPKDDPQIALNLNNLGIVQVNLREFAAAKKSYEEALAIRRQVLPKDDPRIATSLGGLGLLSVRSGAGLRKAALDLAAAIDLYHAEQVRLAVVQAEQEQFNVAAETSHILDLLLSAALTTGRDAKALYAPCVRVKGSVTTQQRLARQLRDTKDPSTVLSIQRFRAITQELTGLSVSHQPTDPAKSSQDIVARIQSLSTERAELERQLNARSTVYQTLRNQTRLEPDDILSALQKSENAALVDFVDYLHYSVPTQQQQKPSLERRIIAFVVRPGQNAVTVVSLGPSKVMAEWIDRWRASYGIGKMPPEGTPDPAAELRKHLWEPLEKHLKGVKVVLVSPDGPLNGLPFSALPGAKPGTFLVHDYAFAVVPIPQLLPQLVKNTPQRAKEPPTLLLAGAIDFGQSQEPKREVRSGKLPLLPFFKLLPGTESEVNDLRVQFEDAFSDASPPKVLRKDKATKQAVLTAAPSHRFVHLATHGFFASPSEKSVLEVAQRAALLRDGFHMRVEATGRHPGLLSGVVFAGVNRPDRRPEETILTALEAGELDLGKVELVVLSACDTGRGQVAGGEGVLGLQRAFQLAGARSVVASLWSVPDEETHQLMREFYRRVWTDKPLAKAEALRQAQLWMLDNWKPRSGLMRQEPKGPPPPYVWAAFVLSGDWR